MWILYFADLKMYEVSVPNENQNHTWGKRPTDQVDTSKM